MSQRPTNGGGNVCATIGAMTPTSAQETAARKVRGLINGLLSKVPQRARPRRGRCRQHTALSCRRRKLPARRPDADQRARLRSVREYSSGPSESRPRRRRRRPRRHLFHRRRPRHPLVSRLRHSRPRAVCDVRRDLLPAVAWPAAQSRGARRSAVAASRGATAARSRSSG